MYRRPFYFVLMRHCIFLLLFMIMVRCVQAGGPYQDVRSEEMLRHLRDLPAYEKEDQRLIGGLLAVMLGTFGAHRLYLGTDVKVAVIYGITFGGFGLLPLIDLGHLLFAKDLGPFRDNNRVFMWAPPTPQ